MKARFLLPCTDPGDRLNCAEKDSRRFLSCISASENNQTKFPLVFKILDPSVSQMLCNPRFAKPNSPKPEGSSLSPLNLDLNSYTKS